MDELTKIREGISRLPKEIINLILFYSHSYQPKYLLEDIKNVNIVKKGLLQKYWSCWEDDDESNDWLINDIFSYVNKYRPLMDGYVDNFYNIFFRHVRLKNKLQVDKYIKKMEKNSVVSQINIFLGLLTPEERNDFFTSIFW